MEKGRVLERRHLIYYLRVFDRNTGQLIGHLTNITSEGAMLTSEAPIEINTIFQLGMELPSNIKQDRQITFDAKSLWCKKDTDIGLYETGFQIQNLDSENTKIIEHLIEDFGLLDGFFVVI